MRGGITKVHQHAITQILSNMPLIACDDLMTGRLIGHHTGMILFRIELLGKGSGAHKVNEHYRQLTPLSLLCSCRRSDCGRTSHSTRCLSFEGRTFAPLGWHGPSRRLQGRSTLGTELRGGRHLLAATRAEPQARHPTLDTELRPFWILRATARTAHAASLLL